MNARAGPIWSRTSTPRNWTRPRNWPAARARSGASSMHGPHHDAQTLITTGFPRSVVRRSRKRAPSNSGSSVGLDGSDTAALGVVPGLDPEHAATSTPTKMAVPMARTTGPRLLVVTRPPGAPRSGEGGPWADGTELRLEQVVPQPSAATAAARHAT